MVTARGFNSKRSHAWFIDRFVLSMAFLGFRSSALSKGSVAQEGLKINQFSLYLRRWFSKSYNWLLLWFLSVKFWLASMNYRMSLVQICLLNPSCSFSPLVYFFQCRVPGYILKIGRDEHVIAICNTGAKVFRKDQVVMSNQRFLKIVCFRFPTNVPKKNRIYSFFKQNLLSNQNVLFQIKIFLDYIVMFCFC